MKKLFEKYTYAISIAISRKIDYKHQALEANLEESSCQLGSHESSEVLA